LRDAIADWDAPRDPALAMAENFFARSYFVVDRFFDGVAIFPGVISWKGSGREIAARSERPILILVNFPLSRGDRPSASP
jgi:hypothetical protein